MSEETEGGPDGDRLDVTEAFSLLADGTRAEIVGTLHDGPVDPPVEFSTLYDHVDVADTARFNYHLGELRPHFVAKGEDGYDLTAAGRRLARAVVAGTYTAVPEFGPFEVDGRCYACDEPALSGTYADEVFRIDCGDCGESVLAVRVPPTVARGRDPREFVDAFERWSREQVRAARRGICPDCGGPVDPQVVDDLQDAVAFDAAAAFECAVCGREAVTSFGSLAYRHPPVRAFHRRRGNPIEDRRTWEVDQFVSGRGVEVESRDPWLVRVTFHADGDACHVDVDGNLAVVRTEIVPGGAPDGG